MSGGRRAARFSNDVTLPRRRPRVSPCCERIFPFFLSPSLSLFLSLSSSPLSLSLRSARYRDGWILAAQIAAYARNRGEDPLIARSLCLSTAIFHRATNGVASLPSTATSTLARPANMAVRSLGRRETRVDEFAGQINYMFPYRSYHSVVFA